MTLSAATTVSDADNLTLTSATVTIIGGTFVAGDVLAANVTGTGITASYNAATGVLTLTGADTLAHYQQVLDSVTYSSSSQTRPTSGANPTSTISWVVNDGSGSNSTATATTTISITGSAVKNDVNGDRKSDILFQASIGPLNDGVLIYTMNGTTVASQAALTGPGLTYHVVGAGDFNGDGKADILWPERQRHAADLAHERLDRHVVDRAVQSRHRLARDRHRRLQRRRQGRHPVAEFQRHAADLGDERHVSAHRERDAVQSGRLVARGRDRRFQRRRQGRHRVARMPTARRRSGR